MKECKSVYIHIPFCTSICSYCDFCKMFYNEQLVSKYLNALEKEIRQNYKHEKIKTLYIGGGTPSSLSIENLHKLFKIIKIFNLEKLEEFTFECNVSDLIEEKLQFLYENKVNRLSIGVQTFNKKFLKFLNRKEENVKEKIEMVKRIGFKNINVDLIYALPGETLDNLEKEIDTFLKLDINHISTYSLIIEPNTILKAKNVENISEELDYEMYKLICEKLKQNGFEHYEISNFSKKGFYSKHNLTYWNNLSYYGFGLGATGYINNIRYTNTKSINRYLEGEYRYIEEKIDMNEMYENEMILGLRKIKGVNKKNFYKKYHKNIDDVFNIKELLDKKYLIDDGENIFINEKYLYVQNSILMKFIGGSI